MKNKGLLLFFLFFLPALSWSQQLQDVVVSATEIIPYSENGRRLIWTLGESMTELYATGAVLDQGFLQYDFLISSIDAPAWEWNIKIWPNPVAEGPVHLLADAGLHLKLIDSQGRLVASAPAEHSLGETLVFDLFTWPTGTYWLLAEDEQGRRQAFPIIKF